MVSVGDIEKGVGDLVLKKKAEEYESTCPSCGVGLNFVADLLHDENITTDSEYEELLEYFGMEINILQCPSCRKKFIEFEENDYEYMVLHEWVGEEIWA
jgi:uncharacterized protein with PIN domain